MPCLVALNIADDVKRFGVKINTAELSENPGMPVYTISAKYGSDCGIAIDEIWKTVNELDLMTKDAHLQSALRDRNVGKIAIAYTVWSKKKGGGKLIVKEVFKKIKKSNHLNRLVTLSPLTEMARNFHLRNGAFELQVNKETQNFEYKI